MKELHRGVCVQEKRSDMLLSVQDYERAARTRLPRPVYEYIASGAEDEEALRANENQFRAVSVVPRVLTAVDEPDIAREIAGCRLKFPVLVSPAGVHRMAHPDGEWASARAAARSGIVFSTSQHSSVSLEEVAAGTRSLLLGHERGADLMFQAYILRDFRITESLIRRALSAGYRAIIVTVDSPIFGYRFADSRNGLGSLPPHVSYANYEAEKTRIAEIIFTGEGGMDDHIDQLFETSIRWEHLEQVRMLCSEVPVLVKGVQDPRDVVEAAQRGFAGVILSNHGGRQLGMAPGSMAIAAECRRALTLAGFHAFPMLLDGGIRSGEDVFKALALGCDAVCIGRPVFWGLAVSGEEGVADVLRILREGFVRAMKLTGCASLSDIPMLKVIYSTAAKL
mmetsp:Transcript_11223/g.22357  ORF Transcript_11223/g.22357 Transcript_11223/m.22357 type:complete len:395 (-) Transcript_11223:222-1406(-)